MKSLKYALSYCIVALPLLSGLGLGCEAIFGRYLEPNPPSCEAGCPAGQTCNTATQTCEDAGDLGTSPDMAFTPPTGLTLVAGAPGGKGNADDTGINARFDNPEGIASDGNNTLYIADTGNHCIRKVKLPDGVVSTLAGACGESGIVNNVGASARFNQPAGLAYDGNGNLFIADRGNSVIRKLVVGTQVVTTHSGTGDPGALDGSATSAQFNKPSGIAIATSGLLVADTDNHLIRKVTLDDGNVTTMAGILSPVTIGTGDGPRLTATFNRPTGIAAAPGGLVYISDMGSHLIRRLDDLEVKTILGVNDGGGYAEGGPGVAKFRSPAGLVALDTNTLLVADSGNHVIRRIKNASTTGITDTLAGLAGNAGPEDGAFAGARFNVPMGMTAIVGGVVFVVDKQNHAIRTLDLNGKVVKPGAGLAPHPGSTDGPGSMARFREPRGLATDGQGNIFVADEVNYTIRKINQASGEVSTIAGIAEQPGNTNSTGGAPTFHRPVDVAADGNGNLYISDSANHVIRKLDLATGTVSTLAGNVMALAGDSDGQGTAASFWNPTGLAYDGQGSLFVADTMNQTLRQIVLATGQVTTVAGFAGSPAVTDGIGSAARFNNPMGVACDRQGNVYVSDNSGHVIRKVVVATRDVSTFAGSGFVGLVNLPGLAAKFDGPQGLSIDPAGFLYVADSGNRAIRKIQLRDAIVSTFVGQSRRSGVKLGPLPGRVNYPRAVLWLGSAGLVFSDSFENSILRAL